jgi:hypothetical protein
VLKKILFALGLTVAAATSALSAPLFIDNFDSEPFSLNSALTNWTIVNGSIDVIGPGFYDFYPGNGRYLDMNGTTSQGGTIVTNSTFNIVAGQKYKLSFNHGTNLYSQGSPEQLNFAVGTNASSLAITNTIPGITTGLLTFNWIFTAGTTQAASILFADGGVSNTDNGGPILDNVSLSPIPVPPALPLFLIGVAAVGVTANRKSFVFKARSQFLHISSG